MCVCVCVCVCVCMFVCACVRVCVCVCVYLCGVCKGMYMSEHRGQTEARMEEPRSKMCLGLGVKWVKRTLSRCLIDAGPVYGCKQLSLTSTGAATMPAQGGLLVKRHRSERRFAGFLPQRTT